MTTDDIDTKAINGVQFRVEANAKKLTELVDEVIAPYVRDLDKYVKFISNCLKDGENPPTDAELDDFALNLSTYIYWTSGACEQIGIRDDLSRAIYKEIYNYKRNELQSGTVADKDSIAELFAQEEHLTNICYNRAYKIVKAKVENAQELLGSVKKVLSHRLQEMNLTNMSN